MAGVELDPLLMSDYALTLCDPAFERAAISTKRGPNARMQEAQKRIREVQERTALEERTDITPIPEDTVPSECRRLSQRVAVVYGVSIKSIRTMKIRMSHMWWNSACLLCGYPVRLSPYDSC